jgi:hypothetical protein
MPAEPSPYALASLGKYPKIERTEDLERIAAMPVRHISRAWGEALSIELTQDLTTATGKANGLALKWIQAIALNEIYQCRGAYLGIPVGGGKTLISFLSAYILDCVRPFLVIPEALMGKTRKEFHAYTQQGWITPLPPPTLLGMTQLRLEHNLTLLDRLRPDLVFIDEADILRNWETSAPMRLDRYKAGSIPMLEEEGEWFIDVETWSVTRNVLAETLGPVQEWARCRGVPFVVATGTGMRWSIRDFSHLLNWSREHGSPVPLDAKELGRWANALDEQRAGSNKRRLRAGALLELAPHSAEGSELDRARAAFRTRMLTTPGVIIVDHDLEEREGVDCDQPLALNLIAAPEDADINDAFETFRLEWTLPDGQEIIDSLSFWRGELEMGCGFWGRWKYPPPEKWRADRRAYFQLCTDEIKRTAYSTNPTDTAKAVAKAFPNHPVVRAWNEIKGTFTPEPEAEWISDSVVRWAVRWAKAHKRGGLIWTSSVPVGEAIAAAADIRYYGAEGESADGYNIEHVDDAVAVASINANTRGRNLQYRFNNGAVVGMPQSAEKLEQLFGRYHRSGQTKPVTWDLLMTSGGTRDAFNIATREAKGVLSVQAQKQKILRGRINDWNPPSTALRWARRTAD